MLDNITNTKYWFYMRTKSKEFVEGGKRFVITVKYGIDGDFAAEHNQTPYFSITGDITTKRGTDVTGGCIHDEIIKHFPELAHLVKWHLVGMHFVSNSVYWMQIHRGWKHFPEQEEKALDHFKSTSKIGVVPGDDEWLEAYLSTNYAPDVGVQVLKEFLAERAEPLTERYVFDMLEAGAMTPPGAPEPEDEEESLIVTFAQKYGIEMRVKQLPSEYVESTRPGVRSVRMDRWVCNLSYEGRWIDVPYGLGEGHNGREPEIDEVLRTYVEDATSVDGQSFADWADEFGYNIQDADERRRTRKMYDGCVAARTKLIGLLGQELFDEMAGDR